MPSSNLFRLLLPACIAGLLLPFVSHWQASDAGWLSWLLDLATHWQWLFCLGIVLCLVLVMLSPLIRFLPRLSGKWIWSALFLPLPFLSSAPGLPLVPPGYIPNLALPRPAVLTLASANMEVGNTATAPLRNWLASAKPDVVVLLEVSPQLAGYLPQLKDYPYQVVHAENSPFGIALLSRLPLQAPRLIPDAAGINRIEAGITLGTRTVNLTALHPMPPLSPYFHRQRNALLHMLTPRNDTPSIVAGDFNATPWSSAFNGLEQAGWRRATGLRPSWPSIGMGVFGIPIDHVLASRHWHTLASGLGPDLGSDHRPVLVQLSL